MNNKIEKNSDLLWEKKIVGFMPDSWGLDGMSEKKRRHFTAR